MNTSILGGITFVVVFAGIILLNELGIFVVARLMGYRSRRIWHRFPPTRH